MDHNQKPIIAGITGTPREIIAMQAPVEIVAAEAPAEGQEAVPPTFSVRAYNGGALRLNGWKHPVVVDLSRLSTSSSVTANLFHDSERIVGHVTETVNDGKTLDLKGVVSGTGDAAKEVTGNAKNKYPWQASIEASPTEEPQFFAAGKTFNANGQTFTGPAFLVASDLYGFAFLPRGADGRTSVTIAAAAATTKECSMDADLIAFAAEIGMDYETATDDQKVVIKACFEGKNPKQSKAKDITEIFARQREEEGRREGIADIVARAIQENPHRNSDFVNKIEVLANAALEANTSVQDFELQVLRATRAVDRPIFAASASKDGRLNNDVMKAAICLAGGLNDIDKQFNEQTLEAAHKAFPTGITLNELIIRAARDVGYRGDTYRVTTEVQDYAMRKVPQITAGYSTLSLPGILSNSAYKFLLDGWGASDMEIRKIASTRSVRDFKQITSYRLNGAFKYVRVAPGGELAHGQVGEDSYTNQAKTYGIQFTITREDIINDDLSALTSIPREMGFGAADSLNEVAWTEFLDNSTFFASGNNNVSTGALNSDNLAAAETVFMNQTKPNGQPLAVMPAILLVPTALKRKALNLMNSETVISGTATATQGGINTFKGNFEVVSSPFLSNANFTGYSAFAYYLLADPRRLSTLELAYLNGRDTPVIEDANADFGTLGIRMRGYHDFGASKQEYRAGVRSTGA